MPGYGPGNWFLSTIWDKALVSEITPTQLIEYGDVELLPTYSLKSLLTGVRDTGKYATSYKRRKRNNPATNTMIYNGDLTEGCASAIVAQACGSN